MVVQKKGWMQWNCIPGSNEPLLTRRQQRRLREAAAIRLLPLFQSGAAGNSGRPDWRAPFAKANGSCWSILVLAVLGTPMGGRAKHLPDVLKLQSIFHHGYVHEIIGRFGGADQLRSAVNRLQSLLCVA